ncbi:MAG TPA: ABC transporter substrate-binding protein, partial [Candidatus Atribacteria bacterium]|nr:ABC transporter substrate-binding protein [Candidatus Atribacteria bacterium]
MKKSIFFILILLLITLSFTSLGLSEETPQYGGTLVRPDTYGDPVNLDPILTTLTATYMVNMLIFDGLVRLNGATGKIEPAIARSWEIKNDGKTYIFHLRKGVKFHNGREVKAADFKYSFERIKPENRAPHIFLIDGIVGAKDYLS